MSQREPSPAVGRDARLGVAVIGHGRAGRARVREILARPDLALRGIVSRSEAPGRRPLEAVLADPDVALVIVCTENARHATFVDAALRAGKHVAVEFPLGISADEGRALLALAVERGRTLYVEHIELLTAAQEERRRTVAALRPITEAAIAFQGGHGGWIADPALAGSPAHAGIARLHVLLDLFGPLDLQAVRHRPHETGYDLEVDFVARAAGHPVTWTERRAEGLPRSTVVRARGAKGQLPDPVGEGDHGRLFGRDLERFVHTVREARSLAADHEREIVALELADEVARRLA